MGRKLCSANVYFRNAGGKVIDLNGEALQYNVKASVDRQSYLL